MAKQRKICVVTGTRAEYGLLYWLMKALDAAADVQLQVVASAMHLSPEFGLTYRQIEADGFAIDAKVEMLLSGDTPTAITKSMGLGCIGFADVFDRLAPDIIVLLGDRYEVLAAAQAALIACIPVAHIHGGERSEGAADEAIRHAVTKMSHLHFVAAEEYRKRVIQLGEAPARVFTVGAPGLDHLDRPDLLGREALSEALDMDLTAPYFSVTYHPVTLSDEAPQIAINALTEALDGFLTHKIVITAPNSDTRGREAHRALLKFAEGNPERVHYSISLGQVRYLSLLKFADAIIGNSSSGIIEAPGFQIPTVNIGDRQRGRIRAPSVIDCDGSVASIRAAIEMALSTAFRATLTDMTNPFGDGRASERIAAELQSAEIDNIIMKTFHDLPDAR